MVDGWALALWALVWASVGACAGLIVAAVACNSRDDELDYDRGFKAGYEQAELDRDMAGEIARCGEVCAGTVTDGVRREVTTPTWTSF